MRIPDVPVKVPVGKSIDVREVTVEGHHLEKGNGAVQKPDVVYRVIGAVDEVFHDQNVHTGKAAMRAQDTKLTDFVEMTPIDGRSHVMKDRFIGTENMIEKKSEKGNVLAKKIKIVTDITKGIEIEKEIELRGEKEAD